MLLCSTSSMPVSRAFKFCLRLRSTSTAPNLGSFTRTQPPLTMLRILARSQLRTLSSTKSTRNFVSTVLLSKTYENKSLAELRELARSKGLPM